MRQPPPGSEGPAPGAVILLCFVALLAGAALGKFLSLLELLVR